jgi:hypothetical protein
LAHKLKIACRIPRRFVRDEEFRIILEVTNIGKETFGGGRFKIEISTLYPRLPVSGPIVPTLLELPPIEPNSSYTSPPIPLTAYADGLRGLFVEVEASDGKLVEHYQREERETHSLFLQPVYVLNREHVQIISLLEEVIGMLKRQHTKRHKRRGSKVK